MDDLSRFVAESLLAVLFYGRLPVQYLTSDSHGSCAVVFLLQELPDSPEVSQLEPAGL